MNNFKISVIIPTYKPQDYLWECLDSLKKQTFGPENFEVIIILNGCNEPYYTSIKEYINNVDKLNINLVHTDLPGVSNARNIGIDISKGDYISFIDDDDYVSDTYLQKLFKIADANIIAVSNTRAFEDGTDRFLNYSKEKLFNKLQQKGAKVKINHIRQYFSGPCMKLIPRNVISDSKFDVNLKNGEDSLFMFLISKNVNGVILSDSDAIYYRRFREGSAYTTKKSFYYFLKNRLFLIYCYTKIYTLHPFRYNFIFFITRILACFKAIIKF